MLEAAEEREADAIGMSGLLVKSTLIMRENLEEMNERGLAHIPVLLGGAALTRTYVERDLRQVYEGRLFYGKDAFEGLRTMDRLVELRQEPRRGRLRPAGASSAAATCRPGKPKPAVDARRRCRARSPTVATDNPVFTPPFLGSRVGQGHRPRRHRRLSQRDRPVPQPVGLPARAGTRRDDRVRRRVRAVAAAPQLDEAQAKGVLVPQVVYGYFAANADGNDLVLWTDETRSAEMTRFTFPRQKKEPWLCIADFFRPVESGEPDYAAFQVVTMGPAVSTEAARLLADDHYTDYLYLHGLGVEMAEALAEYWHRRIREEWGFADEDGPTLTGLLPPAVPGRALLVGLPGLPRPRGQRQGASTSLGADRIGVEVSEDDGVPDPPRADHRRHHLPPPAGQVLRGLTAPSLG